MFIFTCILQGACSVWHVKHSSDILHYILLLWFLYLFVLLVLEKLLGILTYVFQWYVQEFCCCFIPRCGISTSYMYSFLPGNGNYFSGNIEMWIFLHLFVILYVFNNLESMWNCIAFSLDTSCFDVSLGLCLMNFIFLFIFHLLICLLLM